MNVMKYLLWRCSLEYDGKEGRIILTSTACDVNPLSTKDEIFELQ